MRRSDPDHLDFWDGRQAGMGRRRQRNVLLPMVFLLIAFNENICLGLDNLRKKPS